MPNGTAAKAKRLLGKKPKRRKPKPGRNPKRPGPTKPPRKPAPRKPPPTNALRKPPPPNPPPRNPPPPRKPPPPKPRASAAFALIIAPTKAMAASVMIILRNMANPPGWVHQGDPVAGV